MGIFSKPQKKDELMLVFNIGSSSVGGALFWAQKTGVPKIVFSAIEPLKIEEKVDAVKFLEETTKSLEFVAGKIHNAGLGAPKKIFCVLSSPWYTSQTRTINFKKNTPFVFTEKFADELIQKEIKLFNEEHIVKYPEEKGAVRPIELKNIKTLLNGYEAPNPISQKVKELEMIIFISMSGESILKNFEEAIGRHFHFESIKFSSFAMSSFTVVRDLYAKEDNFLLVDIGGEVTEIFMAKKNVLRESISYPLGRNFLVRGVASILGCTLDEAVSLLSLMKDGHAEASVAKKIKLATDKLKVEWLKNFQESLAHLSKDISIPSTIYIIVDENMAEFFDEIIKSEQFSQYTLTESKFAVTFLSTELLRAMSLFEGGIEERPFLVMDCVYINRFLTRI
jgi:cell division ATPase FtsA